MKVTKNTVCFVDLSYQEELAAAAYSPSAMAYNGRSYPLFGTPRMDDAHTCSLPFTPRRPVFFISYGSPARTVAILCFYQYRFTINSFSPTADGWHLTGSFCHDDDATAVLYRLFYRHSANTPADMRLLFQWMAWTSLSFPTHSRIDSPSSHRPTVSVSAVICFSPVTSFSRSHFSATYK